MNNMISEEEIKNIVTEGYRNILKRDPDPGGLVNYTREIKNGLSIEKFYDILRTSEEHKQRFDIKSTLSIVPISSVVTLAYCMIGFNKIHEIRPYIETILPYVDRFIFIDGGYDGGSTDGTVEYLQSLNFDNDNKIEIYVYRWKDNFSDQRNNYLKHYSEKMQDGWILVSDTDEHFPIDTISKLKDIIRATDSEGYNGIQIRAYDIITDDNNSNKIISETTSNFWKPLLFRYHPSIHYEEDVHENLKGNITWKQIDLIYQHTRSQRKIYERAVQNFWISSYFSQHLKEFRYLCTNNNILNFRDFFKIYKEGNLPKDIEDWIYNHRNYREDSKDLEVLELRDMAKLYYDILHPNKKQ